MNSIILAFALLQTPDSTVPVHLHDRVIIITRSEAESWYKSLSREKDWATVAALEIALGTAIDNEIDNEQLTPQERERFRWHRRALQGN